jgi:hypothetical protein
MRSARKAAIPPFARKRDPGLIREPIHDVRDSEVTEIRINIHDRGRRWFPISDARVARDAQYAKRPEATTAQIARRS